MQFRKLHLTPSLPFHSPYIPFKTLQIMPSYLIVIVLYGKRLAESSSICSLTASGNLLRGRCRLVVWDNSPMPCAQEELESLKQRSGLALDYRHNDGENIPLSTLYNRTIELLSDQEMLVILDDDSVFDADFFIQADQAILSYPDADLYLPVVRNGKDIVSPAAMVGFKGHYLKEVKPGPMSCHHRTAINSGMIISARYLKHEFEGYDERIRFYFTDNDFMSRFTASHQEFIVLDYTIQHTLNFYARGEDYETKSRRLRELRRSFLILMRRRGIFAYLSTWLYLVVYSIKFAIIHRDVRYIFVM